MAKRKVLLFGIFNLAVVLIIALFSSNTLPELVRGTSPSYTVSLTASDVSGVSTSGYKNGTKTVKSVIFDYVDALDSSSYHVQLKASSGTILNDAATQITSILSIRATYNSTTKMILTTGMSANPSTNSTTLDSGVDTAISGYPYFSV